MQGKEADLRGACVLFLTPSRLKRSRSRPCSCSLSSPLSVLFPRSPSELHVCLSVVCLVFSSLCGLCSRPLPEPRSPARVCYLLLNPGTDPFRLLPHNRGADPSLEHILEGTFGVLDAICSHKSPFVLSCSVGDSKS
jgi:hypothetical protein